MNIHTIFLFLANAGIFAHIEGSHLHLTCEGTVPTWLTGLAREYKPMLMAALLEAEDGLTMFVMVKEYRELIYSIALLNAGIDPNLFYRSVEENQQNYRKNI